MGDEYIRREDAIRLAEQGQVQGFPWQFQMLVRLPSADVTSVIHGKWERHMSFGICDKCRYEYDWKATDARNFCPNCGAKMDGEE